MGVRVYSSGVIEDHIPRLTSHFLFHQKTQGAPDQFLHRRVRQPGPGFFQSPASFHSGITQRFQGLKSIVFTPANNFAGICFIEQAFGKALPDIETDWREWLAGQTWK